MINELKSSTKSALNDAWGSVSDNLPKSMLFWSACGAVIAAGAVYFIKPVRRSLLRLVGLGKRRTRSVAKRTPRAHRIVRQVVASRARSSKTRSRKMAHAR
jgi:hypothetical protein